MTEPGPRVGLSLRHDLQRSGPALLKLVAHAEKLGYDSVWIPHHTVVPVSYESVYPYAGDQRLPFAADTVYGDALTVGAYVAAATTRIKIATNVIPLLTQHPVTLAKQAATIDHLSGGRLELGLGAGWLTEEATILDVPSDRRGARLDEAIDIMRKAWTGAAFEHEGRFWTVPPAVCAPAPAQGPDLPIWIGGGSPAAIRTIRDRAAGAIMPPGDAGLEMLARMRDALPGKRFAVPVPVGEDMRAADLRRQCVTLSEAGASIVVLYTTTDAAKAADVLTWATEHLADVCMFDVEDPR